MGRSGVACCQGQKGMEVVNLILENGLQSRGKKGARGKREIFKWAKRTYESAAAAMRPGGFSMLKFKG